MTQININCPKCRRFLKIIIGKFVSKELFRGIAECGKCKIKVINSGKFITNKNNHVFSGISEEIDNKTFEKYKKQFQEKKKSAKNLVLDYLQKNRKAVTKHTLSQRLNLKESIINRIIRVLKKAKLIKVGFIVPYRYGFGKRKKYIAIKNA